MSGGFAFGKRTLAEQRAALQAALHARGNQVQGQLLPAPARPGLQKPKINVFVQPWKRNQKCPEGRKKRWSFEQLQVELEICKQEEADNNRRTAAESNIDTLAGVTYFKEPERSSRHLDEEVIRIADVYSFCFGKMNNGETFLLGYL